LSEKKDILNSQQASIDALNAEKDNNQGQMAKAKANMKKYSGKLTEKDQLIDRLKI
jgi:peptidoglycan hydrolase CwlO-like protein